MNLRPTDKSKHMSSKSHFLYKYQTKAEELQDHSRLYRRENIYEGDNGLPVNSARERQIMKLNKKRVDEVQNKIKALEPQNDFEARKLTNKHGTQALDSNTNTRSMITFDQVRGESGSKKKKDKDRTFFSQGSDDSEEKKKPRKMNLKLGYNPSTGKNYVPFKNFHHKIHFKTIESMLLDQIPHPALTSPGMR